MIQGKKFSFRDAELSAATEPAGACAPMTFSKMCRILGCLAPLNGGDTCEVHARCGCPTPMPAVNQQRCLRCDLRLPHEIENRKDVGKIAQGDHRMADTRIVALARPRVGADLHAAHGSMADDLGRLAAGVITLDMDNQQLWLVMKAARDHVNAECDGGSKCGFGQHSASCTTVTTFEALKRAIDSWDAVVKEHSL